MTMFFSVENTGTNSIDPQLGKSILLINGEPLPDWAFVVGNGPRDNRWSNLPANDSLDFSYALGDKFGAPGRYRVQLVVGGIKSNVAEFGVSVGDK